MLIRMHNLRYVQGYLQLLQLGLQYQVIFGFDYPQAIYAWEQGKNAPTIDNLLVLSYLFGVNISEIVVSSNTEIKIYDAEKTA